MMSMSATRDVTACESKDMDTALEFLEHSGQVSSEVVLALRQCLDGISTKKAPAVDLTEGRDGPSGLANARKFKPSSSKRQQLTEDEAAQIYMMRPAMSGSGSRPKRGSMICCKTIAPKFGVSSKTIRDIWRGRTWAEATKHLWTEEERIRRAQGSEEHSESDESEARKIKPEPSSEWAKPRPTSSPSQNFSASQLQQADMHAKACAAAQCAQHFSAMQQWMIPAAHTPPDLDFSSCFAPAQQQRLPSLFDMLSSSSQAAFLAQAAPALQPQHPGAFHGRGPTSMSASANGCFPPQSIPNVFAQQAAMQGAWGAAAAGHAAPQRFANGLVYA